MGPWEEGGALRCRLTVPPHLQRHGAANVIPRCLSRQHCLFWGVVASLLLCLPLCYVTPSLARCARRRLTDTSCLHSPSPRLDLTPSPLGPAHPARSGCLTIHTIGLVLTILLMVAFIVFLLRPFLKEVNW